jgi:ubiquinone/menaquinone biosynthesis C-methylase UbiE
LSEEEIKNAVRKRYSELAALNEPCCEQSTCCQPTEKSVNIPTEALQVGASCGSPLTHTKVEEGQVVLDLGSGGGIDVFRASKLVGRGGKVIGLDATPEMVFRARETAKKYDYCNVEFRLGEIEHMPIESNSVDLVISNCVLNLVPDKRSAFKEIYRVLKPGGKISISDMVATQESKKIIKPEEWAACIAGAVTFKEYKDILEETGFTDIEALDETHSINEEMASKGLQVKSIAWTAQKPG